MLSLQEQALIYVQEHNRSRVDYSARRRAIRLFWRAYSAARAATLLGRRNDLLDLGEAVHRTPVRARYFAGIASVPLADIRGSEGRRRDFDARLRPLHNRDEARWVDVAATWLTGDSLPPVELIRVGEVYYIRDGHHRVSVAAALGQQEIDARVTVWEV